MLQTIQILAEARSLVMANNHSVALDILRTLVRTGSFQSSQMVAIADMVALISKTTVPDQLVKVAILGGATTTGFCTAVRVASLFGNQVAEIYESPFASFRQEILDTSSGLYQSSPDIILITPEFNDISYIPVAPCDETMVEMALKKEVSDWLNLWELLKFSLGKPIIQHLFVRPEPSLLGVAERLLPWGASQFVEALNKKLIELPLNSVYWLDLDSLATHIGRENWFDPRLYYYGKVPFSLRFLPQYTAKLESVWRGINSQVPKALVLDLDNTLWGGIIGDDGLDGINLGPETPEGEAYHAFCVYIKNLSQRGIILCICSKNEIQNAIDVFKAHPHMPLSQDDFAVIKCNWGDKASNLLAIAQELNVDISALVFVDDNPAECELIRQTLPEVHVVQMDGDPAFFVRRLDSTHLFDSQRLSNEDLVRKDSYQARAKAANLQSVAPDLKSYLCSLEMLVDLQPASVADLSRLAQMELKTNQFNLSTRRLDQERLNEMRESDDFIVLTAKLEDRFTKHGLVSYLAIKKVGTRFIITDWLMSCRVFSRTLEHFMLRHLLRITKSQKVNTVSLKIVPSAKNGIMKGVFTDLGFQYNDLSHESWDFQVDTYPWPETFIEEK